MSALFRSIPRAATAARNRDWNGAQAILLAGVFAVLGVNEGRSLI